MSNDETSPHPSPGLDYERATRLAHSLFAEDVTAPPDVPPEVRSALADPAKRFGRYVLVEQAGAGGMGEVMRAWQTDLRRWVALKLPKAGAADLQRFLQEARAAAGLDHPSIAKVFDAGEVDGRHFIAMEWVDGGPVRPDAVSAREAARLIAGAAEALHHAHERGVIHRDLKPSNLLVTRAGRPVVVDFGLARPVDAPHLTGSGLSLGTPSYMAPEQALGQADRVGPRSDVYGLGATLYHLVAGRPPHAGSSAGEILAQVARDDPAPPRALNRGLDRDLETIVLRCLERDPDRRYPTAAALADDLNRWLRGEPITARPIGRWERARRRARRNPVAATLLLVLVAGSAVGTAFFINTVSQMRRAAAGREAVDLAGRELLLGRLDEVERAAARAGELLPASAGGPYWRGRALLTRYVRGRDLPPAFLNQGYLELAPSFPESAAARELRTAAQACFARVAACADCRPEQRAVATGLARLFDGKADEAAADLDRAWQSGVVEPDIGLLRTEAHYRARRFPEALAALEDLAQRHEKGPSQLLWESRVLHALGVEAGLAGRDPLPQLGRALEVADAAVAAGGPPAHARVLRALALVARAAHEQETGAEPGPTYAEALKGLEGAAGEHEPEALLLRAEILLVRAGAAGRTGAENPDNPTRFADALAALSVAVAAWPDYAGAWLRRAQGYRDHTVFLQWYRRPRWDELALALAECDRALALAPGDPSLEMLRTQVKSRLDLARAAGPEERERIQAAQAEELARIAARAPDPAHVQSELGSLLLNWVDEEGVAGPRAVALLERATQAFDRVLAAHPTYLVPLNFRATAQEKLGQAQAALGADPRPAYEKACADHDRAVAAHPRSAKAWTMRGVAWEGLGSLLRRRGADPTEEYRRAEADLDRAVALDPRTSTALEWHATLFNHRGLYQRSQGRDAQPAYRHALADLSRAMELSGFDPELFVQRAVIGYNLAIARQALGADELPELTAALADAGRARTLCPGHYDALLWSGRTRLMMAFVVDRRAGDAAPLFDAALADFEALVALRAEAPEPYLRRATARTRRALYRKRQRQAPADDLAQVERDLERVLRLEPRSSEAYYLRGLMRSQFGDPALGQEDLEQAFRLDPKLREAAQHDRQ